MIGAFFKAGALRLRPAKTQANPGATHPSIPPPPAITLPMLRVHGKHLLHKIPSPYALMPTTDSLLLVHGRLEKICYEIIDVILLKSTTRRCCCNYDTSQTHTNRPKQNMTVSCHCGLYFFKRLKLYAERDVCMFISKKLQDTISFSSLCSNFRDQRSVDVCQNKFL